MKHNGLTKVPTPSSFSDSVEKLHQILNVDTSKLIKVLKFPNRYYKVYPIKRKGKYREINEPKEPLKYIQKQIVKRILSKFNYPLEMQGGIKKRSQTKNATMHTRKNTVVKLDIKNFFPSTSSRQILMVFNNTLNFDIQSSELLTKLTTFNGKLPQGCPTSTYLGNLVLLGFNSDMQRIAKMFNCTYSILVDDVTISGNRARAVIEPTRKTLREYGYLVKNRKTEIIPSHKRQVVTGYVVNTEVSVSKEYIKTIEKEIRTAVSEKGLKDFKLIASLYGKIQFIRKVKPKRGNKLLQFFLKSFNLNKENLKLILEAIRLKTS